MVLQSRKFGCVWKPGFVKSGHIYVLHIYQGDSTPIISCTPIFALGQNESQKSNWKFNRNLYKVHIIYLICQNDRVVPKGIPQLIPLR